MNGVGGFLPIRLTREASLAGRKPMQASTEGRGEVESVLALQRSAGNHAVTHLLLRLAAHGAPAARLLARGGNKGEALPVKPVIVGAIKGVPIKRYPPAGKPPGPQVHISTPAVEDLPEGTHGVSKNPPGSKTVKPSTEAGLFTHEHYERFADELRANAEKLTSEQLPAGLEREVRIPDTRLTFERRPKIDRLDRAAGEVIEIKPAHLKANGLAQAESYASLMNVHDPLPPPRKWKARVVTYDQQKVVTYVEDIGVLEVPKPHSTPQSKGAATKAKTPEKPSASAGERARTSSGWDPKSGPPENKLKKGPNFKPQPHEYDLGKPRVSSGSAAGFKALTKAKEEALRAEGSLVKGVRYGPAVGKAGRAAGAVADFLLPGPLDAIMAFAAVGQAYQENRANAKGKGLREGFARGLAARLVFSGSKARHLARVELAPRFVDASVEKQVAGVAGAEEKGIVLGLKAGIDFGDRISSEQRQNFLHAALQDLATEGHHWTTEDRKTPANTWYTSENVWNITKALRPTVTKMLDHLHSGCGARERQSTGRTSRIRRC